MENINNLIEGEGFIKLFEKEGKIITWLRIIEDGLFLVLVGSILWTILLIHN
jgi:hypothetical protein